MSLLDRLFGGSLYRVMELAFDPPDFVSRRTSEPLSYTEAEARMCCWAAEARIGGRRRSYELHRRNMGGSWTPVKFLDTGG